MITFFIFSLLFYRLQKLWLMQNQGSVTPGIVMDSNIVRTTCRPDYRIVSQYKIFVPAVISAELAFELKRQPFVLPAPAGINDIIAASEFHVSWMGTKRPRRKCISYPGLGTVESTDNHIRALHFVFRPDA